MNFVYLVFRTTAERYKNALLGKVKRNREIGSFFLEKILWSLVTQEREFIAAKYLLICSTLGRLPGIDHPQMSTKNEIQGNALLRQVVYFIGMYFLSFFYQKTHTLPP